MISIRNFTQKRIDEQLITGLAKKVLKGENSKIELSIVIVGKKRIAGLNRKYRKKEGATDVLSFGEGLNEVFICPDMARDGLEKVLIHGILHILGYKHGEEMERKQNYYLK